MIGDFHIAVVGEVPGRDRAHDRDRPRTGSRRSARAAAAEPVSRARQRNSVQVIDVNRASTTRRLAAALILCGALVPATVRPVGFPILPTW